MSFFSDLKAERLIADIRGIGDPAHPEAQKAFQKLARIGPGAIPKILDALAVADKKEAASYVEILTQLVDNKTFPMLVQGLMVKGANAQRPRYDVFDYRVRGS